MNKLILSPLLLGLSVPALADFNCNGVIKNKTIDDNVKVTQPCTLDQVTVKGNVMLYSNAQATILNSTIDGNLESKGNFGQVTAKNNSIDGNIQLEKGKTIQLHNNRVDGNIELKENRSSIQVTANQVDGNLKCESNSQTPKGGQNRVKGDKEGQCRSL